MKTYNAIILFRDINDNVGISFTDNLVNRLTKFKPTSFKRFETISLPNSMTKLEALKYLKTQIYYEDEFFKVLIDKKINSSLNRLPANNMVSILDTIKARPTIDVKV